MILPTHKIPRQEDLSEHIEKFVDTFIASSRKDRWKALLSSSEKRWSKIDVHSFEGNVSKGRFYDATTRLGIGSLSLDPYLDTDVVILRLGHSKRVGAVLAPLREAIDKYDVIFEGIISVVPGRLAIVINHDDEAVICESL